MEGWKNRARHMNLRSGIWRELKKSERVTVTATGKVNGRMCCTANTAALFPPQSGWAGRSWTSEKKKATGWSILCVPVWRIAASSLASGEAWKAGPECRSREVWPERGMHEPDPQPYRDTACIHSSLSLLSKSHLNEAEIWFILPDVIITSSQYIAQSFSSLLHYIDELLKCTYWLYEKTGQRVLWQPF